MEQERENVRMQIVSRIVIRLEDIVRIARGHRFDNVVEHEAFMEIQWQILTVELNELGHGYYQKSVSEWREYWKKIALEAKRKTKCYLIALNSTGNNPMLDEPDNMEWAITRLCAFMQAGNFHNV